MTFRLAQDEIELLVPEIEKAAMELCLALTRAQKVTDVIAFLRAKDEFREKVRQILGEKPEEPERAG